MTTKEDRFLTRVLRKIPSLRKRLNDTVLRRVIEAHVPAASAERAAVLAFLEPAEAVPKEVLEAQAKAEKEAAEAKKKEEEEKKKKDKKKDKKDADAAAAKGEAEAKKKRPSGGDEAPFQTSSAEAELYAHLLVVILLLDAGKLEKAFACSGKAVARVLALPRGVRDGLAAKLFFYHARVHEVTDRLADVRELLLGALRSATLRRQEESQATLINLLLRNYIHFSMYDQADKLVSKSTFPDAASNGEWARHLYYLARIRAIQLDYSEALSHAQQAIRKAPSAVAASGFMQTAHKLMVIVQLLLGEVPDRSIFRQPALAGALQPYFLLTQAVRVGDVKLFGDVLEKHGDRFKKDRNYTLILRVRHNVIKTGVRMINLSYSR